MKRIILEKRANNELQNIQKILLLDSFVLLPIKNKKMNPIAECSFSYPYKNIQVSYSDELMDRYEMSKQWAKKILVHEMIHAVTDELYSKSCDRFVSKNEIEDSRESLVDRLANIIVKNNIL